MSKYLSNEALKLQNQVRYHQLLTSIRMKEISFDPMDFKVLYLLIIRPNLDVSSVKSVFKAIIKSTWKLQGFDNSVMEISIEFRCQGSSLAAILGCLL